MRRIAPSRVRHNTPRLACQTHQRQHTTPDNEAHLTEIVASGCLLPPKQKMAGVGEDGGERHTHLLKSVFGDLLDHVFLAQAGERQSLICQPRARKALNDAERESAIAFCMGRHRRLGKDSPVKMLNEDIVRHIFRFVTQIPVGEATRSEFTQMYNAVTKYCDANHPRGDLYHALRQYLLHHCDNVLLRLQKMDAGRQSIATRHEHQAFVAASNVLSAACLPLYRYLLDEQESGNATVQHISDLCTQTWQRCVARHSTHLLGPPHLPFASAGEAPDPPAPPAGGVQERQQGIGDGPSASLATPPPLKVQCSDGAAFTILHSSSIVRQSAFLQAAFHRVDDGNPITVVGLHGVCFAAINEMCEGSNGEPDFDGHLAGNNCDQILPDLLAAHLLHISPLVDSACRAVAGQLSGASVERMREMLHVENDFTPEEEEQVRRENAWFED